MSPITTHILDTSIGRPAAGVAVALESQKADGSWQELARGVTNADGRVADLLAKGTALCGVYRMRFAVESYFAARRVAAFYPYVEVVFTVESEASGGHYHIPLLLSPFGYSTYRGS